MFEALTTVTFAEQNGKTKQTMRARVIKTTAQAAQYLAGMEAAWTQSLERLTESLAFFGSAREFVGTRILGGFLKNDEFSLGDRHALSLE